MRRARGNPIVIALVIGLASCSLLALKAAFEPKACSDVSSVVTRPVATQVNTDAADVTTAVGPEVCTEAADATSAAAQRPTWTLPVGPEVCTEAADVTSAAAQRPTWTLLVSFGVNPRADEVLYMPDRPHVRFVGLDRILVGHAVLDNEVVYNQGKIWTIEKGEIERTLPRFPCHFDPIAPRAAVSPGGCSCEASLFSPDKSPGKLMDLVTGTTTSLEGVVTKNQGRDLWTLVPELDAVAVFVAPQEVHFRSTKDGTVQNVVTLPPPPPRDDSHQRYYDIEALRVSTGGDRLAVAFYGGNRRLQVCDLVTGRNWKLLHGLTPIGFAPDSLVCWTPVEGGYPFPDGYVIRKVRADGSQQDLSPSPLKWVTSETLEGLLNEFALSGNGEVLAYLNQVDDNRNPDHEIVVRLTGRAHILRRLLTRRNKEFQGLALSARGERLAVVYCDGLIDVYELPH